MKEARLIGWDAFADCLQQVIRAGASSEELAERFGGVNVEWVGKVSAHDLSGPAPGVIIEMPERIIELGDGRTWAIGAMNLPISEASIADWAKTGLGDTVCVEATLGSVAGIFPAVELVDLGTGRTNISIRVINGKIINR